ncbi:2752_t:CDS:1, partial [Racocetra fulgida]
MGNKYRIMVDIVLTCRLFKEIETNSKEFTININTGDYIANLKEKICKEVKKTNNEFLDIEADGLSLWKVEIDNNNDDEFSSLVLPNDNLT